VGDEADVGTDPDATDPGATDPDATDPGATDPDATDPDATDPACCAGGVTGYRAFGDCTQFYQCVFGVASALSSCGAGLLFDGTFQVCNWAAAVSCNAEACVL
jgi:hypothetical protein